MDDFDLYLTLKEKEKVSFSVDQLVSQIKAHKPEIIGAAAAAALTGAHTYVTGKRWKKGEPSRMERNATEKLLEHKAGDKELEAKGEKPGFARDLLGAERKTMAHIAELVRKHPGMSAGGAALAVGAPQGAKFGKLVDELRKRIATGTTVPGALK